ncbi:MAG: hypothetical protein N2C14_12970 [Planctomycetales bacterium]
MPNLPAEPDFYPEDLFSSLESNGTSDRKWWAIYTMSRREKTFMRRLTALEVPFYGPLIRRRTQAPNGRKRESFVPLFPNYVFVHGDDEQRRAALTTNCVSKCLPVADAEQLTRDLSQLHAIIEADIDMTPEARLEPGTPVRICSGSMAGLEGVVLKRHGQERLVVAVRFLQQGASILVEDFAVEPISA